MNIQIDNPCPMHLSKLKKGDGKFLCKSCSHEVTDFRNMTDDEIKIHFKKGSCGVFFEDQLSPSMSYNWTKKVAFKGLVILSLLGFSVKPMVSQNNVEYQTRIKNGHKICVKEKPAGSNPIDTLPTEKKKKKRRIRKTKRGRVKQGRFYLGCPSF